jgi:hypothetical protein
LTSSFFGSRRMPIGTFVMDQVINIIGHFDACGMYACGTLGLFFECTRFPAPRQGLLVQHV